MSLAPEVSREKLEKRVVLVTGSKSGDHARCVEQQQQSRVYAQRSQAEACQHHIRAQRAGFTLYAASAHAAEDVAAARVAAEAAVARAEEREASDLLAAQALVAADHAVAALRAAVILAANTARDYTAAAAEAHIQSTRHNTGKHFARWVDQTVTGLIRASQRAAVQGWKLIQAANAVRATAAPRAHDRRAPRAPGQAEAPTASGRRGG